MWYCPVKFGGDSGAMREVSDIGGGFRRASFTVRSRGCHGIRVKREIINACESPRELELGQGMGSLSCHRQSRRACGAAFGALLVRILASARWCTSCIGPSGFAL